MGVFGILPSQNISITINDINAPMRIAFCAYTEKGDGKTTIKYILQKPDKNAKPQEAEGEITFRKDVRTSLVFIQPMFIPEYEGKFRFKILANNVEVFDAEFTISAAPITP